MLNVCGCLVHVMPENTEQVIAEIDSMAGCDVHAHDKGRLVVTVEDIEGKYASEQIMDLHKVPGVLTITLSYHQFEPTGPNEATAPAH